MQEMWLHRIVEWNSVLVLHDVFLLGFMAKHFLELFIEGQPAENAPLHGFQVELRLFGAYAAIKHNQYVGDAVPSKGRDGVLEHSRVADIPIMNLVKNRYSVVARDAQTDLHDRSTLDAVLVLPELSERAASPVKKRVGHVIDDAPIAELVARTGVFKDPPLNHVEIELLNRIHRIKQPRLCQAFQPQHHIEVRSSKPLLHFVYALVIDAMSVDQAQYLGGEGSQFVVQPDVPGKPVEHKKRAERPNLIYGDVRQRRSKLFPLVWLYPNVANVALHNLSVDSNVLDFGKVDAAALPDFAYERHL